jgi:hypothetical protein
MLLWSTYSQLVEAQHVVDVASLAVFTLFASRHADIAHSLLDWIGDRQKAACWMAVQRKFFKGKSGYELVIDGDVDVLSDHINAMLLLDAMSFSSR